MSPSALHRIEHHDHLPTEHIPALRDLLQATGHEFVPPLSSRTSSTQTQLAGETAQEPSVEPYLEAGGYWRDARVTPELIAANPDLDFTDLV